MLAGETGGLGTIAEFEEEESDTENNSQSGGERNEAKAAANTEEEQSDFEEDEASESEFRYWSSQTLKFISRQCRIWPLTRSFLLLFFFVKVIDFPGVDHWRVLIHFRSS